MEDEVICYCKNIKKSQIIGAINNGDKSLKDIQKMTLACTGNKCKELNSKGRCCINEVKEILREFDINESNSTCCSCSEGCC